MSIVEFRFQPSPEHVRTARLVAVAVARRAGLDDERLDEIRLGMGEVCARAVRRSQTDGTRECVAVEMSDGVGVLEVVVTDHAGVDSEEAVSLALIQGLADTLQLEAGPGGPGGVMRMMWTGRQPS